MKLTLDPQDLAFREEVRAFFREQVPAATRRTLVEGRHVSKDQMVEWIRILHAKGWAVPHWPAEHGGTGWDPLRQYIFLEELQRTPAPPPLPFGVNMVGPVIYTFGNAEQKARFLPRIANMDDWWCQGFSEPGAGSDLASLTTRAVRNGDRYVVNGQKTWTTFAQYANWIFCLVRTDLQVPKQRGISFLLIDMRSPGVEVRPIVTIDGGREINEVFLTDVEVPIENLVGEENKGWDYAKFLLGNERTNIARIGISKFRIDRIRELAAGQMSNGKPLLEDERFLEKLAAIEIELKALELTQLRVVTEEAKSGEKGRPSPASSILKIKGSEIQQATTDLLMRIMGVHAMPYHAEPRPGSNEANIEPADAAMVAPNYFNFRKVSIYGGSNEIQKNIIAKAVLGL
ncbi:MAG: pimeloyl-CoA dehydrogenase large subunit [Mesorhizobium sp.]|nr:pimeloyl-CoA dehydrogenase large subunit [Mesorhizobium sp.]